jgi:glutamate decarboxylase
MLRRWRARRLATGQPADRPKLVSGPIKVCWHQFTRYREVELREIPSEADRLLMTPEEVLKRVDENTIGLMPTLGVTFICVRSCRPLPDVRMATSQSPCRRPRACP